MKITLTLAEAIEYIRDHEDFDALQSAEIIIEDFEPTEKTVEVSVEKPKARRKRRTKEEMVQVVTQEDLDAVVAEASAEVAEEFNEVIPDTAGTSELDTSECADAPEVLCEDAETPVIQDEPEIPSLFDDQEDDAFVQPLEAPVTPLLF